MADDNPRNPVIKFFSNPLVGGLGTVITVISILLAIYFYLDQREFRKLTYCVHPVKATIVKAGQVSKLKAVYDGIPINTDITAAQVALWNQGKSPIKSNDILQPIVFKTADKSPILEATIRKVSRDLIKLQLQLQEAQIGRITISWQILEQNDGGVIQLVYCGAPDLGIHVDGALVGQKEIERVQLFENIESRQPQIPARFVGIVSVTGALVIILMLILFTIWRGFNWLKNMRWGFLVGTILGLLAFGIFLILVTKNPGPPFGF